MRLPLWHYSLLPQLWQQGRAQNQVHPVALTVEQSCTTTDAVCAKEGHYSLKLWNPRLSMWHKKEEEKDFCPQSPNHKWRVDRGRWRKSSSDGLERADKGLNMLSDCGVVSWSTAWQSLHCGTARGTKAGDVRIYFGEQSHVAQDVDKLTSQAFSNSDFWVPSRERRLEPQLSPNGSCVARGSLQTVQRKSRKWMGQTSGAFPFHSTRTEKPAAVVEQGGFAHFLMCWAHSLAGEEEEDLTLKLV